MAFCEQCGTELNDGDVFCTVCGAAVEANSSGGSDAAAAIETAINDVSVTDTAVVDIPASSDATQVFESVNIAESNQAPAPAAVQPMPQVAQATQQYMQANASQPASKDKMGTGAIIGIACGSAAVVLIIAAIIFFIVNPFGGNGGSAAPAASSSASASASAESSASSSSSASTIIGSGGATSGSSGLSSSSAGTSAAPGAYVLADSSSRYYSREELQKLSNWELYLARNEIYARHGRGFKNQDLANYFASKSWYRQQYTPEQFDAMPDPRNDFERKNSELMLQIEQARGSQYLN